MTVLCVYAPDSTWLFVQRKTDKTFFLNKWTDCVLSLQNARKRARYAAITNSKKYDYFENVSRKKKKYI